MENNDSKKTVAEYLLSYGYSFEQHKVLTDDNYVLSLWRIPKKLFEKPNHSIKKQPVLLMHGCLDNGFSWILKKREENLAMILVREGYDVWIGNNRGNIRSLEHIDVKEYDWRLPYNKYWDFSFHEMAIYDFPAMISYIQEETGFDKVAYVGHSQGTSLAFIYATFDPQWINQNLKAFIGFGPALKLNMTPSVFMRIFDLMQGIGLKNFWVTPFLSEFQGFWSSIYPNWLYSLLVTPVTGVTENMHFDITRFSVMGANSPGK
jgi:pimeloyl-ACP methyl ester carboxylesterase